jgi:hypothetical protein
VSLFYHRHRRGSEAAFERYLTSPLSRLVHRVRLDNWGLYAIDGRIAVDRVLRYENIADEFAELCAQLGIARDIRVPEVNRSSRTDRGFYRHYYTDRTRDLVARWYPNEIAAFGYEF